MVSIPTLWLPILISAGAVFVASSVIHMFLGYHANDFRAVPDQDRVMDALRPFRIPPGDYAMPHAGSMKEMQSPEYAERLANGPVVFMTVRPSGRTGMGTSLATWFAYIVVTTLFVAYVAGRALPPGAEYLDVFRFAGTTAFIGYALALWQSTIWFGQDWRTALKNSFDGAIYALITAGVFGWLWP